MGLFFADSALLLLVLALSGTQDLLLLWLMTCAVSLSGRLRLQSLVVVNVIYVITSGTLLFEQSTLVTRPYLGTSVLNTALIRSLGVGLLFAIIVALISMNKRFRYRRVVSVNLLLLLLMLGFSISVPAESSLADVVRGATMLYSKYFWAIAFSIISLKGQSTTKSWTTLASLTFWTPTTRFHIGAIPRGVGELLACERRSKIDLEHSRRSGIILVSIGCIIVALNNRIPTTLLKLQYPFQLLPQMGTEFLGTTASTALLWIDNIVQGLQYFMRSAAQVSIAVGLVRFAGFHIPLAQFKIWRARNFSDLFRRIYFYYSETLTYFFYFPIWSAVRRLQLPRKIEASVALFSSVFFGGLVIHGILDVPYFLDNDDNRVLLLTASRMPYLFAIAFFSTLSSVFQVGQKSREKSQPHSLTTAPLALALLTVYLFCLGLVRPTVDQISAYTQPSLDWQQLSNYVMKMLGR